MFYVLLYVTCVHFSVAVILVGKKELIALHSLSSWCLVVVEGLFLALPRGCPQFLIVVFPDHTHLLSQFIYSKIDMVTYISYHYRLNS